MKTAISIPDQIFNEAERVADELKISRSELYTKALAAFLWQQRVDRMTKKANEVYAKVPSNLDPVLMQMQMISLPREEW